MVARHGTFFVTGNHEYYSGAESWLDETDRLGMTNLLNEHRLISRAGKHIAIAGITDFRAHQIIRSHRSNPKQAIKNIDNNVTKYGIKKYF